MASTELVAFTREEFAQVAEILRYVKRGALEHPFQRARWPLPTGSEVQEVPAGECSCCGGCVCFPDSEDDITSACGDIGCLLKNYTVSGNLPFSGDTSLTHDADCDFLSAAFDVVLCGQSYGSHHWALTVASGCCASILELVNDGTGAGIPLSFVGANPFLAFCGNEFVRVENCGLYATDYLKSISRSWPAKVCVNPVGSTDCADCDVPDVPCPCPAEDLPDEMEVTVSGAFSTSFTMTRNGSVLYPAIEYGGSMTDASGLCTVDGGPPDYEFLLQCGTGGGSCGDGTCWDISSARLNPNAPGCIDCRIEDARLIVSSCNPFAGSVTVSIDSNCPWSSLGSSLTFTFAGV